MLISLSDDYIKNSLNYVIYEYIGTCGCSSKSAALRSLIKRSCEVGTVLVTIKPHNNIDDESTTFKVDSKSNQGINNKVSYSN